MRWLTVVSVVLLAACSGTLPPGPMGQPLDMREYLPDTARSGTPDSTFRAQLKLGPDSTSVEMEWATFRHTTGRYVSTLSGRTLTPSRLDSVRIGNVSSLQNMGTKTEPIESGTVQLLWFKHTLLWHSSGAKNFGFDALGRRTIGRGTP